MTMNITGVGWTDLTWNVWSGCKAISTECKHCYAETLTEQRRGLPAAPHGFELTVRPKNLGDPARALRTHGPSLIFCESMSDVGLDDDELTPAELDRLHGAGFETMDHLRDAFFDAHEGTPEHRYQVLTKRPQTLIRFFRRRGRRVPPSCWIGVTIGHASTLDKRLLALHELRALGARVLFISAEPLLGDLVGAGLRLDGIDWLIAGGESGTHASDPSQASRFLVWRSTVTVGAAKPISKWVQVEAEHAGAPARWVRRLRDEAARAGCAFFFKQWGGPRPDSAGRLLDGVEHDGMPVHVVDAMPQRRTDLGHATAALARKRMPLAPEGA